MTFEILALVMTVACCVLGVRFIFFGGSVLNEWRLESTAGALILFRRMGLMYLGLALMFYLGRTAAPSEVRSAVCLLMGGTAMLLAGLGLFEFSARRVSAGIFRSVFAEAVLGAAFIWVWWAG
ncbi:hypothetical protein C8N35_104136 [Breoghania corrubedonensis]|uniref:DUF4345 domain-containing protein n=1 Tax=Breoghania corrubedonensis TaxID=665038 RepID=A0A2T5V9S6_9HYPH|nr:hypothetical protein [Breoghania corrubedonensis]PTW60513.1 hypothetical protein C8N35_104136 [Breoghania corrubedonensis]